MNKNSISDNLKTAIQASLNAGKAIMDVYDSDFAVEVKDDKSPLTEADKRANDIINTFLVPTKIPVISEENKQTEYEVRKLWDMCWIVDPVDGTKEFIEGVPNFVVSVALVENGFPIVGVLFNPVTKEIFTAASDEGAHLNGETINCVTKEDVCDMVILNSRSETRRGSRGQCLRSRLSPDRNPV